jgi:hypothetical protein
VIAQAVCDESAVLYIGLMKVVKSLIRPMGILPLGLSRGTLPNDHVAKSTAKKFLIGL